MPVVVRHRPEEYLCLMVLARVPSASHRRAEITQLLRRDEWRGGALLRSLPRFGSRLWRSMYSRTLSRRTRAHAGHIPSFAAAGSSSAPCPL